MDIRTKLVFSLVAVTLGSMLAFGFFMNLKVEDLVGRRATDQLESLASSGEDAVGTILDGWQERVQLIASRTQLRLSLREYADSGDSATLGRISLILDDAAGSVRSVAAVGVYDTRGRLVAAAGANEDSVPGALDARSTAHDPDDEPLFLGVLSEPDGVPQIGYSKPLTLGTRTVGYLFVLLNGERLIQLTSDSTGLGETGEMLVVRPAPARVGAWTLHPVRHLGRGDATEGGAGPILLTGNDDPALIALAGTEGVFTEGLRDYRDEPVWASTRFLDDTGWGLVVKFDAAERQAAIDRIRDEMVAMALSLAGLGLLVAIILGFRLAAPIHELAKTAGQIREGDLGSRAAVTQQDEIGLLARTFNSMADELQERMTELNEYKKFFDMSLDLLCIAGTDGYFKTTNPAFTHVLGWTQEELTARPFFELIHPDDVEATEREIAKLARGLPTISFLNRFRCADGSYVYLRWNSYPEEETGRLYATARRVESPHEA